ncbi:non-specific lipid transfer protein GPI-anchored 9-like isoform X1 [Henckelia pumila]|uniref:non-specific lipid transfer protein GPI-anchored 9-like isoform X1 n=1 Tax=Henckelia pumila TaxID=405737 RepID=UPI003C6E5ACB
MAKSNSVCLFFLVICSLVFIGFSDQEGGGDPLGCIQKLLPCQPYLKSQATPPPSCCVPMKQVVAEESQCLCAVFNNRDILISLNVTQQDGINLAKSCGANVDQSNCKKDAPSPAAPSSVASPKASPAPSTSSNGSAMSPPPKSAGSSMISHAVGSLSLAAIFSLIILAF